MKNKFKKVAAGLLAMALVVGVAPASEGVGELFGGTAVVVSAADQTETLLTTITATAKEQASYSTEDVATVSFSYTAYGSSAYLTNWGWWGYGWTATVTPVEGYTITKCVFYDDKNRTATDSDAPFVVETTEEDKTPKVNDTPILAYTSKGITKIEVYGYATPVTVSVTGVTLKESTTLTIGNSETLEATVEPKDATDKTITWKSSNEEVATVDANGTVTALKAGQATITATATNGTDETTDDKSAGCVVTVKSIADTYQAIDGTTGWCLNKSGNAVYLIYRLSASEEDLKKYDFISILNSQGVTMVPGDTIAEGEDGYEGKFNTVYTAIQFPDNSEITAGENEYLIGFEISGLTEQPKNFSITTGVNE